MTEAKEKGVDVLTSELDNVVSQLLSDWYRHSLVRELVYEAQENAAYCLTLIEICIELEPPD